ncbi:hypothetical protein Tco_0156246 [Tanacetum coccineum]
MILSTTDSDAVPCTEEEKLDSEFSEEENKLEMADTQAEIILSQGLPRHIFNNLNQTSTAKEIWDNVEMLMQGSGRTIQQRKEDLFDEYERFRAIRTNQFHDSCAFPQCLLGYLKPHLMFQNLYSSQSYEPHAKALKKQEQSTRIIANLLSGFQKQFPPTNNQLRTSSNTRTHATVHDGQIVTEPVQRKAPGNNGNTGTRGKKLKRKDVLDAEAEAFLADVECTAPYDQLRHRLQQTCFKPKSRGCI